MTDTSTPAATPAEPKPELKYVRIYLDSGSEIDIVCTKFEVVRIDGVATSMSWTCADGNSLPYVKWGNIIAATVSTQKPCASTPNTI